MSGRLDLERKWSLVIETLKLVFYIVPPSEHFDPQAAMRRKGPSWLHWYAGVLEDAARAIREYLEAIGQPPQH